MTVEHGQEGPLPVEVNEDFLADTPFNTPDALVKGYKDLQADYSRKENYQKKYDGLVAEKAIPDSYEKTLDLEPYSAEHIDRCSEKSKELGLTQAQFESLVKHEKEEVPVVKEVPQSVKDLGISDSTYHKLTPEEQESLSSRGVANTPPVVSNTGNYLSSTSASEGKSKAYAEMKEARRTGNRAAEMKAFNSWKAYTKG